MRQVSVILIALVLQFSAAAGASLALAAGVGVDALRPHRAVYDLALDKASERSGITGMDGRIVYEMTGSSCEGYSVRFRFLTNVQTPRKSFTNDQRTTSFESGDGKNFQFVSQSYLNGQLEQEVRGNANRAADKTKVTLKMPEELEVDLAPSVFMTQHIGMLIDAARKQQTIVTATVYDASDMGDELVETTAIIGKRKDSVADIEGEPESVSKKFGDQAGWKVSVSYFSTSKITEGEGEKTPIYQVSFLMHESGVSRDLKMQYADYSLRGGLKEIEYLKATPCKSD